MISRYRNATDKQTAFDHVLDWHPGAEAVQCKLTDADREGGIWLAIEVTLPDASVAEITYRFRREGV